jgi:hypothetical protein
VRPRTFDSRAHGESAQVSDEDGGDAGGEPAAIVGVGG